MQRAENHSSPLWYLDIRILYSKGPHSMEENIQNFFKECSINPGNLASNKLQLQKLQSALSV